MTIDNIIKNYFSSVRKNLLPATLFNSINLLPSAMAETLTGFNKYDSIYSRMINWELSYLTLPAIISLRNWSTKKFNINKKSKTTKIFHDASYAIGTNIATKLFTYNQIQESELKETIMIIGSSLTMAGFYYLTFKFADKLKEIKNNKTIKNNKDFFNKKQNYAKNTAIAMVASLALTAGFYACIPNNNQQIKTIDEFITPSTTEIELRQPSLLIP